MRKRISWILLIGWSLAGSCGKKPQNNSTTGGGIGGNGIISVTPEHHGQFIDSCSIYIKYGTTDAPANGLYDDSVLLPLTIVNDTIPVAVFRHLKTGSYYIYGVGLHTGFTPPYVKGGRGYTLTKEDSENVPIPTYTYNR